MRYAPMESLHPILGRHVQVRDLREKRTVTLYTGPRAWEFAEARCAELNASRKRRVVLNATTT